MTTTRTIPQQSKEFVGINVLIDGTAVTTGVEIAVVQFEWPPIVWRTPDTLAGTLGYLVDGLAPGLWVVWARVTPVNSPERPVLKCGIFRIE